MATATMTLERPQRFGPALRRFRIPYGPLVVSATAHVILIAGIVAGAAAWRTAPTKTYVVNLVPAVAALGTPRPEPSLPPRTAESVTPPRPVPNALPPQREMPPRDVAVPDRTLPRREPALPRPGDKELPTVASSAPKPLPVPPPPMAAPRPEPPASPPLGSATGSPQGAGAVTLNVADFPYAYYIQAIHSKIQQRW